MSALSNITKHPKGFWFFFWGELAERSSYYGMRAILTLYMVDKLGLSQANAGTTMSLFIAGCYFLPLLGGWIADNLFGKYWTIVGFSVPYILGHVILGVESVPFLIVALVLLAMGSGVIKPNISTLMGLTYDQERKGDTTLRTEAFELFYIAINLGSAMSSFAMPWIRSQYSYAVAFLFPAALMVVSFTIFAMGKKHYAVEVIEKRKKTPEEKVQQRVVLSRIGGIFLSVTFFWAIFDQAASTWTLFAANHMDLTIFGVTLQPDMIQGFNPILVIVLVPVFSILWGKLAARGIRIRSTDKMLIGFILTGLTMVVMSAAGFITTPEAKVNVGWEIFAYVVVTCAEVCISVVGLELAYTAAPKQMKSFVTACWLVTVALANFLINAPITRLYATMEPGYYFGMLAVMMIPVTAMFIYFAKKFNETVHDWDEDEAAPAASA